MFHLSSFVWGDGFVLCTLFSACRVIVRTWTLKRPSKNKREHFPQKGIVPICKGTLNRPELPPCCHIACFWRLQNFAWTWTSSLWRSLVHCFWTGFWGVPLVVHGTPKKITRVNPGYQTILDSLGIYLGICERRAAARTSMTSMRASHSMLTSNLLIGLCCSSGAFGMPLACGLQ